MIHKARITRTAAEYYNKAKAHLDTADNMLVLGKHLTEADKELNAAWIALEYSMYHGVEDRLKLHIRMYQLTIKWAKQVRYASKKTEP